MSGYLVEFELDKEQFSRVGDPGETFLPKGDYKISVGGLNPSDRSDALSGTKTITSATKSDEILKL